MLQVVDLNSMWLKHLKRSETPKVIILQQQCNNYDNYDNNNDNNDKDNKKNSENRNEHKNNTNQYDKINVKNLKFNNNCIIN